jgi:hypothetical protein
MSERAQRTSQERRDHEQGQQALYDADGHIEYERGPTDNLWREELAVLRALAPDAKRERLITECSLAYLIKYVMKPNIFSECEGRDLERGRRNRGGRGGRGSRALCSLRCGATHF